MLPAGCSPANSGGAMKVTASIYPIADFCKNVGREHVQVSTMIPAGANAHTYAPTSGQVESLARAKVFVMNGLELETWATSVVSSAGAKDLVQVKAGEAVPTSMLLPSGELNGNGHTEVYDPHVWLDPELAKYEIEAIRDGFARADPANANDYAANATSYLATLQSLDQSIKSQTATFKEKNFVAVHSAWGYFARQYGLDEVGAIEELPGKEPSFEQLKGLVDEMKRLGVKVIFAEPQTSSKAAGIIAGEVGKDVRVITVDTLGNPDNPEVDNYVDMMRHDVTVMAGAMR
jgi:zinc transport system substrate-binding protein